MANRQRQPPAPLHLLRTHQNPISSLHFNSSNTLLFAGDQNGWISITSLQLRRVVCFWRAHKDGILGLEEWAGRLISQGRDNRILIHEPFTNTTSVPSISSGPTPNTPPPQVSHPLPTNSLNFCRFSIAPLGNSTQPSSKSKGKRKEEEALIAVPNIDDSELADIYHLPSCRRVHTAINFILRSKSRPTGLSLPSARSGLIMALHLNVAQASTTGADEIDSVRTLGNALRLVVGYEDGRVEVWACLGKAGDPMGLEGEWEMIWQGKEHNEADPFFTRAFTVSADHLLCRYDLSKVMISLARRNHSETTLAKMDNDETVISAYSTGQMGNASIAISSSGLVVAVGGWDGQIRLFSASSFKPLGVLSYHRDTVHALAFAAAGSSRSGSTGNERPIQEGIEIGDEEDEDDEEYELDDAPPRERWLASGGKDTRLAIWGLMDFSRG